MRTTFPLLASLILAATISTASTEAGASETHCDIELGSEIAMSDEVIRISNEGSDVVLTNKNSVYLDYQELTLTDEQRLAVERYASEIRQTIPEIVTIALEGVEIALSALSEVAYGLFEAEPPVALTDAIAKINTVVDERVRYEKGEYFITSGKLTGIDSAMEQIEPAIESAISASIGQMFTDIGTALAEGGDVSVNIEKMTARFEGMGERVEARMQDKADLLESRADQLCDQVKTLASSEQELHDLLPQLRSHSIVRN